MLQNFVEKKVGVKKIFSICITYSFRIALEKSLLLWSVIRYPFHDKSKPCSISKLNSISKLTSKLPLSSHSMNSADDVVIYLTIVPRVCVGFGYNHFISNKGEWNNCFIKNAQETSRSNYFFLASSRFKRSRPPRHRSVL